MSLRRVAMEHKASLDRIVSFAWQCPCAIFVGWDGIRRVQMQYGYWALR